MLSHFNRTIGGVAFACLAAGLIHSAPTDIDVVLDPPPPLGVGDDTTFFITGTPGELPFLIYSPNPGPMNLPIVGQVEVGMPFYILNLPFFPASGELTVPCPLNCDFASVAPFYAQVLSIQLGSPVTVGCKSEQVILSVDSSIVEDCNGNLLDDDCELETGTPDCDGDGLIDECEEDCDGNQVPDECEAFEDCNGNFVNDVCELEGNDCDGNMVPDDCQPDCDGDLIPDACEEDCDMDGTPDDCQTFDDCNMNGRPDSCDIADGTSGDCDGNMVPDECQPDCDMDGTPDACETDTDGNGTPDDCEDCDGDGTPDNLEADCDGNGTPDDCEPAMDCNGNSIPDRCDISDGTSMDCDGNMVPDECQPDCNSDGTPDACEADTDGNGTPDECEDCDGDGTPDGLEADCDGNGTPDDCEPSMDCNGNTVPDRCDISSGNSMDCDGNMVPDECQPDCDADGLPDACEADMNGDGTPDDCEDCDNDGTPDNQEPDCDMDGLPDDCENDCNSNGIPDDCEGCVDDLHVTWDADDCAGPYDSFSEFLPEQSGGCANVTVVASGLNSPGGHSCTDDAITGTPGGAFCINQQNEADFDLMDSDGLYFSVMVSESQGVPAQVDGLSFWQQAPEYFFTSQQNGSMSSLHENDFPRKYGLQVLRNGTEILLLTDLDTSRTWEQESFDFSTNSAFTVVNETATFDFYLVAYDDQDLHSDDDEVWDLDQFQVSVCCGQGGSAPDCDGDGMPDFCEPDCDNDGLPDDCETDCDMNGLPDDCQSDDCDGDGVPDTCEEDENDNGIPDHCEVPCGECDGKVDSLTLLYTGAATLDLEIQDNDDTVVFAGTVTTNQVISFSAIAENFGTNVHFFDDGDEFMSIHTSCSDPIGIGSVYGDFEVLGGSSEEGGPFCTVPNCGDCDGKVDAMTLLYTGAATLDLVVEDSGNAVLFAGPVTTNQVIVLTAIDEDFGSNVEFFDGGNEFMSIHTSCSDEIYIGSVFGDFEVLEGSSSDGGPFCEVGMNVCADGGKPETLTARYTGNSCFATQTLQSSDKWGCSGDPNDEPMVHILAYKDGGTVYFDGIVSLDETFVIDAANAGQSELSSNTNVDIFDLNGNLLQQVYFHTSCSQPLFVGDVYGSVEIIDFFND